MCGIAGLWNLSGEPVSPEMLHRFTDSLAHRGPDGNGFYIDPQVNLGLGHRRLAILDTSDKGRQPMAFAAGRYWIVYNGEIYNFLELKAELEKVGYSFETDSDTEVILTGYHHWGEDCQLKFNGMWAIAIWDRDERRLFLSRDRFGVKPLLYHFSKDHFAFASEMKAFLALDWFQPDFDPSMVALALSNEKAIEGNENTLVVGLNNLLGGHCLSLRAGERPVIRRWWNTLEHLELAPQRYGEQVERFRELFLDACRIRMRSDVPIGTALSGGLDSSSVVCGMHHVSHTRGEMPDRIASDWQKAFIMTYPGESIDERKYADEVVKQTGVQPVYCTADANSYLDHFDEVLFQLESISDIHFGPWQIYKAQRDNGVVVTMDGHGGDEALGGYQWYLESALKDSIRQFSIPRTLELVSILRGLDPFPNENFYLKGLQKVIRPGTLQKQSWLRMKPAEAQNPVLAADQQQLKGDALFKKLYIDFHISQLPTVLRNFDRLSMAHGVEVRAPLMDWRLICFAFSLPSSSKIGQGFTKRILRDAVSDILPESVRRRTQKLGFPNLEQAWTSNRSREFMSDIVHSAEFRQSPVWDAEKISKILQAANSDKEGNQLHRVWLHVQAASLMRLFDARKRSFA